MTKATGRSLVQMKNKLQSTVAPMLLPTHMFSIALLIPGAQLALFLQLRTVTLNAWICHL